MLLLNVLYSKYLFQHIITQHIIIIQHIRNIITVKIYFFNET